MKFKAIQRIIGILLMLFSFSMLPPVLVGWLMDDVTHALQPFYHSFGIIFAIGLMLWLPVRREKRDLRLRDGFLIAVLFWSALSAAGTAPFLLSPALELSLGSAVFETVSGFTTTGATVIVGLDGLPASLVFYRLELHWLGGMGILVLAVALMPMLGVGGMQLYRAEAPGPVKDEKLTPRITETAKLLWYIYLILTSICTLIYKWAGMTWFDAVCHAFSVLATGGFSTHDSSMIYFNSWLIDYITIVFMFLAGVNFSLHFLVWRTKDIRIYFYDSEFRLYLAIVVIVVLMCATILYAYGTYAGVLDSLRYALFHVISIMTSTGLLIADHSVWPSVIPIVLIFVSVIGGCAGSTSGGMKVIRFLLLMKQGGREINQLAHPKAQILIKVNHKPVPEVIIKSVWGFAAMYVATYVIFMLGLMAAGHDQVTAFSAVAACLNNMGVGLGEVASSFAVLDEFSKWWLSFAMIMGRLELFTVLALLSPMFWR